MTDHEKRVFAEWLASPAGKKHVPAKATKTAAKAAFAAGLRAGKALALRLRSPQHNRNE